MAREPDVGSLPTVLQSGAGGAGERLATGHRAGEYVIDRFLGGGGMGEVYAGHHPVIGKKVAVKVIRSQLAASPEAVERFTREARAGNQVDHPNVVDVFSLGRLDDGRLFLVMDLVDGDSLRTRLARGPLAPADALAVLEPIAIALDAAHARGVVHRDLKPDNVMVSGPAERPSVHVLDFGIAKLVTSVATDDARATATLTGQGTWLGTPAYMAPEQWSADGAVPASDRYALAVMTYELLTGEPPFAAGSVPAMMEKHFRAEVPPVTGRGAAVPAAVDAVVRRGMAKDPDARFGSAVEMVDALRVAIGTQVGGARGAAAAATATGGRGGSRRTAVPMLAGGVGIAVTAVGVWIVARDHSPRAAAGDTGAAGQAPTAQVLSTPPGASIVANGRDVGVTPGVIDVAAHGPTTIEVRKPGYLPQKKTLAAGDPLISVSLQPVDGFQGTWALPSGELRRFVRQGEMVVALRLAAASDNGTYYRRFAFVPSTGSTVSFAAEEEHVDPRAPDEPTCHVPLKAQYDYDPGGDELELRKERVQLDLTNGKCVLVNQEWGDPQPLTRIDRAADTATWAESRAGGAAIEVNANPPAPNVDTKQAPAPKPATPGKTKGKGKGGKPPVKASTGPTPQQQLKQAAQIQLKQLQDAAAKKKAADAANAQAEQQAKADSALDDLRNDAKTRGGARTQPVPQAMNQIGPTPQAGNKPDTEGAVDLNQQAAPAQPAPQPK